MFSADLGTAGNRWPVVRLRGGCTTEVVLLSRQFFAVTTHWDRCTVLCPIDGCALCELLPARGLFYAAVICNGHVHLLELGATSANHLEQHSKLLHGGMVPGLLLRLKRRADKSPVHSEGIGQKPGCSEICPIDLARHVMALYKFPPSNPGELLCEYEVRIRGMAQRRNELTAQRLLQAKNGRVEGRV